jgi:hypothetical protein
VEDFHSSLMGCCLFESAGRQGIHTSSAARSKEDCLGHSTLEVPYLLEWHGNQER